MVDRLVMTLAALVAVLTFVVSKPTPPPYIECTDSSECGKDECCTIGESMRNKFFVVFIPEQTRAFLSCYCFILQGTDLVGLPIYYR
uniref:Astakine-like protein 2 n=1 Tax=Lygus hesperus TaxID=30085 RepID=A0A0F6PKE6_LYGHE|nr:astakine-like protein 2 [Lygus hesperus]